MGHRERDKQSRMRRQRPAASPDAVVTVSQYGPDDRTVTKVVAAYMSHPGGKVRKMQKWIADGITESPEFRREMLEFIKHCGARRVIMTTGVIGCIHEEVKDYPEGEECPLCPFWQGRDRWAKAEPVVFTLDRLEEGKRWPG